MRRLPRRAPQKGARVVCALPVTCKAWAIDCLARRAYCNTLCTNTRYLQPTTYNYLLLTAYCLLLTNCNSLTATYYRLLLTTHYSPGPRVCRSTY